MWRATLWSLAIFLGLFLFLVSYLPKVNELWGGVEENRWLETNRHFGFLVNRVFYRLIEYPQFLILGVLGFLSIFLLHYGLKKLGVRSAPEYLIWGSVFLALMILIGVISLGAGPVVIA